MLGSSNFSAGCSHDILRGCCECIARHTASIATKVVPHQAIGGVILTTRMQHNKRGERGLILIAVLSLDRSLEVAHDPRVRNEDTFCLKCCMLFSRTAVRYMSSVC